MKYIKIILLLIILLLSKNVFASTYYGDYYETDVLINYSDIGYIHQIKKYNTYTINRVDLGYIEDDDMSECDLDDYVISEENFVANINTNVKFTKYILINGLVSNYKIYEIEIYNKDELLNYNIYKYTVTGNYNNVNDSNYDTYYSLSNKSKTLQLELDDYYNAEDLIVKMYIKSDIDIEMGLSLGEYKYVILDENYDKYPYIIKFNNDNSNYDNVYSVNTNELYRHYKNEKVVNNVYVENGDNIIEDDYIIEDKYYKRDKLVLEDNIVINNNIYDINDFIFYKTNDVKVNCNVDINTNGKYVCNFILNDINVTKDVYVDINSNIIEDYNDEKLLNNIIDTNEDIETNNIVNDNEVYEMSQYIEDEIISYDTKGIDYYKENVDNKGFKDVKKSNMNNKINVIKYDNKEEISLLIKFIIAIIFIIIDLILIIKRKRKKVESI